MTYVSEDVEMTGVDKNLDTVRSTISEWWALIQMRQTENGQVPDSDPVRDENEAAQELSGWGFPIPVANEEENEEEEDDEEEEADSVPFVDRDSDDDWAPNSKVKTRSKRSSSAPKGKSSSTGKARGKPKR